MFTQPNYFWCAQIFNFFMTETKNLLGGKNSFFYLCRLLSKSAETTAYASNNCKPGHTETNYIDCRYGVCRSIHCTLC